jgi:hypothetical protein
MTTSTTSDASNFVTVNNVNAMKMVALKNYGIGRVSANYINLVDEAVSMFDYESEEVEGIVFGFVMSEAKRWIYGE